ncbi:hypothetical protein LINPERHAP2_LOCUS6777 [Linum perenne]
MASGPNSRPGTIKPNLITTLSPIQLCLQTMAFRRRTTKTTSHIHYPQSSSSSPRTHRKSQSRIPQSVQRSARQSPRFGGLARLYGGRLLCHSLQSFHSCSNSSSSG